MNVIDADYIKKGDNVFLFMVDIYKDGFWTLTFKKAKVCEFKLTIIYYEFILGVRKYYGEKYKNILSRYNFRIPIETLNGNTKPSIKAKRFFSTYIHEYGAERHYYICSSIKSALEVFKKNHITDKKYNEITTRKRERIYRQFVTDWLKTKEPLNFVGCFK
jgi:hypothetical protein